MAVTLERADEGTRVVLSGPLTVREARTLHAALREVAPAETVIVVDDTGVCGVDTSAIQLLVAFARARRQAGRALDVTDGALVATLRRLGMQQELAP
jgi:ABC-type transporter Mla MlaB component